MLSATAVVVIVIVLPVVRWFVVRVERWDGRDAAGAPLARAQLLRGV
jgi:hypothetical protein